MAAVAARVHQLVDEQHRCFLQEIQPLLEAEGVVLLRPKELTGEAPALADRVDQPLPEQREFLRRDERQREARIDEIGLLPPRVLHWRAERGEVPAVLQILARFKASDRLGLGVDREHAPAPAKDLRRVAP